MPNDATLTTPLRGSIWLLYILIVFEILFMVSPFAAYYYAAYGLPLSGLGATAHLGWLTQHILPHFAAHDSLLAWTLIAVSWPLIFIGLSIFLMGFVQIYWAKFTRKGAVEVGLYRFIRHPQYVGLALVGLGTTLFWSRYVVVLAFVTMLFLYYYLAVAEERRCSGQFGAEYDAYLGRTGRFLPRSWTTFLPALALRGWQIPVAWMMLVAVTLIVCVTAQHHVARQLERHDGVDYTLVSLAPEIPLNQFSNLVETERSIVEARKKITGPSIIYVVPAAWSIPELGLNAASQYNLTAGDELLFPHHHGNDPALVNDHWRLLVCRVALAEAYSPNTDLLLAARRIEPAFVAEINRGQVVNVDTNPAAGPWAGIPVPIY